MSNTQVKLAFAERLSQALKDANHPISPTYLANEFNHRFSGQAISVQSANNWLLGKAIPSQDKLSILAIWLNVSSQWLRFGDVEREVVLNLDEDSPDMDFFLKYRNLSSSQKKIMLSLIDEFNKK